MESHYTSQAQNEAHPPYTRKPSPQEIEFMKTLYSIGVLGENRAAKRLLEMILDEIPAEHRPRF